MELVSQSVSDAVIPCFRFSIKRYRSPCFWPTSEQTLAACKQRSLAEECTLVPEEFCHVEIPSNYSHEIRLSLK
jgi:hypothetical protein